MAVDIHELRCAGCGLPIQLDGNTWRHSPRGPGACSFRSCPTDQAVEAHARPHHLDVFWFRYGTGSESYHLPHDEVEYVLWQHQRRPVDDHTLWSAWRTEVAPWSQRAVPVLTLYDIEEGRRHVTDPRQLLATMPPLVAYWLTEKVFPF